MGTKRGPEDCRKAWKRSDYNRTDIAGYPMGTIAPAWGLNLRLEDSLKETLIRGYIFFQNETATKKGSLSTISEFESRNALECLKNNRKKAFTNFNWCDLIKHIVITELFEEMKKLTLRK